MQPTVNCCIAPLRRLTCIIAGLMCGIRNLTYIGEFITPDWEAQRHKKGPFLRYGHRSCELIVW